MHSQENNLSTEQTFNMPKDSEDSDQRLILKGDEKAKFETPTSEVWQSFDFNLIDEGPTTKVVITCLQCKESLEAMTNDQFPEHKCLDKDGR